jgi:uncharacterized protein DUF1569
MPKPHRRKLRFNSLGEALADARAIANAEIQINGNWTPGQIVGHVARTINGSIDGIAFRAPLPVRFIGRLIRNIPLNRGLIGAVKIPPAARAIVVPKPDLPIEEAVEQFAQAIERTRGETMTQTHPAFGRLSHAQWTLFHCRHAENHFSYLKPIQY